MSDDFIIITDNCSTITYVFGTQITIFFCVVMNMVLIYHKKSRVSIVTLRFIVYSVPYECIM